MAANFTGNTTVDAVVHADPTLNRVLAAHGIDTCCGGSATLAQAARTRGIALEDLLRALGAPTASITQPEHHETCRTATCHAVPQPAAAPPETSSAPGSARFMVFSLLFALTFGATLGALMLATITLPQSFLGSVPLAAAKTAHGYAQVFGFAALFIMGVAYHTMPRFKGTVLAAPRLVPVTLWLQTAGVLLVAIGMLIGAPVSSPAWALGTLSLLAAAVAFGWTAHRTLASTPVQPGGFEAYLRAGCLWLVIAAALAAAAACGVGVGLQPAVWDAALWGFAGSWLFGMSVRVLPVFMNLPPTQGRGNIGVFVAYQLAVVAWVTSAILDVWITIPALRGAAGAALAAAATIFVLRIGIFGPREQTGGTIDRSYEKFMVTGYAWLVAALVFNPAWTAAAAATHEPAPSLLLDFGRHAFTLGFLTQMIIGVATRIVPVFTGNKLWSPVWREATYYLLNAAVLARALQVAVELGGWGDAWPYIALSGPLGLATFGAFTLNVFMTMRPQTRITVTAPHTTGEPGADTLIGDLLTIPGALDTLVERGFRPLLNPIARATLAQTVTLRQACRMHGLALEPLVAALHDLSRATNETAPGGKS